MERLFLSGDWDIRGPDEGIRWLKQAAENGSHYATYRLGKEYLEGNSVNIDTTRAADWFTKSAAGNQYAQFFLEHQDSLHPPSVMLKASRLLYHMSRIFEDNSAPPAVPVGQQVDRNLRRKIQEKKIAMGHKPNDREEEQNQG